jgi:hypothetical protein
MSTPLVSTLGTLTAAGVTDYASSSRSDNATFQVTVATIGTNVVIRLEGSLDATSWFNLDSNNVDTTITANGTTGYTMMQAPVMFVRGRLVSLSGGTPSVVFKVAISRQG